MGKLDGKIAIVTGAGRGIGRAIAEAYLQEGAKVSITAAREQAELDQFAKQGGSERVLALLADVTDPEACDQVVEQTIERFGHVDILVNNAARWLESNIQEVQCSTCGSVSKAKLKGQVIIIAPHPPRKSRPVRNITRWAEQRTENR